MQNTPSLKVRVSFMKSRVEGWGEDKAAVFLLRYSGACDNYQPVVMNDLISI